MANPRRAARAASDIETVRRRRLASAAMSAAGLPHRRTAELIGVSPRAFAHYMTDRPMPDDVFAAIGRVTHAPDYFMRGGWEGVERYARLLATALLTKAAGEGLDLAESGATADALAAVARSPELQEAVRLLESGPADEDAASDER